MALKKKAKRGTWLGPAAAAAALGVLGGLSVWILGAPLLREGTPRLAPESAPNTETNSDQPLVAGAEGEAYGTTGETLAASALPPGTSPAMAYATAVQTGNGERVVAMTAWMQERLRHIKTTTGDAVSLEAEEAKLEGRISTRNVEDNRLGDVGVEDQYVFVPGAKLEVLGTDDGETGLAQPAEERTWIRVTYPTRSRALRDEGGIAIRSIVVGVNVSRSGLILKSSVAGNLDFEHDSISYNWASEW